MVTERPENTYYEDDVKGFIQEFFLGGGNVDTCKGGYACVGAPARVLWILMKFWTYLRTRILRLSFNTLSL